MGREGERSRRVAWQATHFGRYGAPLGPCSPGSSRGVKTTEVADGHWRLGRGRLPVDDGERTSSGQAGTLAVPAPCLRSNLRTISTTAHPGWPCEANVSIGTFAEFRLW